MFKDCGGDLEEDRDDDDDVDDDDEENDDNEEVVVVVAAAAAAAVDVKELEVVLPYRIAAASGFALRATIVCLELLYASFESSRGGLDVNFFGGDELPIRPISIEILPPPLEAVPPAFRLLPVVCPPSLLLPPSIPSASTMRGL